jgi:hypothetical protein
MSISNEKWLWYDGKSINVRLPKRLFISSAFVTPDDRQAIFLYKFNIFKF